MSDPFARHREHLLTLAAERRPDVDPAVLRSSLDWLEALREPLTDDEFEASTEADRSFPLLGVSR